MAIAARADVPRSRSEAARAAVELFSGLAYLAPSLVILAIFVFYPMVKSVQLALHETSPVGGGMVYIGLDHFRDMLRAPPFYQSLRVTFVFALYTVPVGLAASLGVAMLANARVAGIGIFRTIFSSTIAVSIAIAAVIWAWLLAPATGVFNLLRR